MNYIRLTAEHLQEPELLSRCESNLCLCVFPLAILLFNELQLLLSSLFMSLHVIRQIYPDSIHRGQTCKPLTVNPSPRRC